MNFVKVRAEVIEDDTGIKSEIPVLLCSDGILEPLYLYLLYKQHEGKSSTWQNRVILATKKLLEYLEANISSYSEPKTLFQTFTKRLYSGTVGDDGFDLSGLYWVPSSITATNQLIAALKDFTDWLAYKQEGKHLNPLKKADSNTRRLNYAAWYRKNNHDFLGHIKDKSANLTVQTARNIRGRRQLICDGDAIAFPEQDFPVFFNDGVGGSTTTAVALRDQLILLLMHGGGLRESEALSLWVTDVFENPDDPESAIVRIYHPSEGAAPYGWKGRNGQRNRSAYLMEKYALQSRNLVLGTQRLGWKGRVVEHHDNYIQVHWFPKSYAKIFMLLWSEYVRHLALIDRPHPYAFISFKNSTIGNPYTLNAFHCNYRSSLARVGLIPKKQTGHSPHGHRHAYGRRLAKAKVDPIIRKKCLHHSSIESQEVYTTPGITEVTLALDHATAVLEDGDSRSSESLWSNLHLLSRKPFCSSPIGNLNEGRKKYD